MWSWISDWLILRLLTVMYDLPSRPLIGMMPSPPKPLFGLMTKAFGRPLRLNFSSSLVSLMTA